MPNLWFAQFEEKYKGEEPHFYDASRIRICQELELAYDHIMSELQSILDCNRDNDFKNYGDNHLQFPPKSWTRLVFKVWGIPNPSVLSKFTLIHKLLEDNPAITSAFISRMGANSKIKRHSGETNAVIRIHLGLIIPDSGKAASGICVGNETRYWKEGESIAFLDAHSHEAWNDAKSDRYVLIIDLLREEFQADYSKVCTRMLLNQVIFNLLGALNNQKLMVRISNILDYLVYPSTPIFLLGRWVQKKWGFVRI